MSKQALWTVQPAQAGAAGLCCGSHDLSAQLQAVSGLEWGCRQALLFAPLTDL